MAHGRMTRHVPMTAENFNASLDYLGLSLLELGELTGLDDDALVRMVKGEQAVPLWLCQLTLAWIEFEGALKMARENASALRVGGTALEPPAVH